MGDDAGERHPETGVRITGVGAAGPDVDGLLPVAPVPRGPLPHGGVLGAQQPRVGGRQIAVAVGRGHAGQEAFPGGGEVLAEAAGEQIGLRAAAGGQAGEHHREDAVRPAQGVQQPEHAPPGAAEDQPPVDAEVVAQQVHVVEQTVGGVRAEAGCRVGGVRRAAPAAALVEQHQPVGRGVEVPPRPGRAAGARPAVHDDGGDAVGISAGFPVHAVALAHVQHAVGVRLDLRVQRAHRSSSSPCGGRGPPPGSYNSTHTTAL